MYEKTIPKLNKKRCLKTDAKKSKNTQKMTPKSFPKDEFISGVAPLGAPLVAQTAFGHQKLVPSAAQVLPMIENDSKITPKSPPIPKKLQKSSPFGAWPGGLREALTITSHPGYSLGL